MAKTKLNTVTGQEDVLNQNLPIDIETDPPKKENGKKSKNNTKSLKNLINADYEKLSTEGVYDYQDLIKPTTAPIKTVEGVFPRLPKDYFEPYEDYINPTVLKSGNNTIEELQKLRALNQSNWEQFGNAMGRLATNIVPQIIGGFSSMVDIPGYFSAEQAANNSLVNWAADVKERSEEAFPIYEEAPGESMQIGDFAWWMTRGEGLVESVGAFLAQGAGAAKLASWGLKGTAAFIRAKNLTRAIAGAEKSKRILQGSSALTTATMLNQSEAVLEATQVYRDIYQDRLDKGYNQDEARKAAASAAATTISINRINILLNLTSASAFLQPMKFTRKFLKAPTKARTFRRLGLEAGQEGVEELVNLAAEKAGRAKGIGEKYTFQNALKDIKTMEGFEAAFLGAIGGIAQTGGQIALSHSKYGPGTIKDAEGNRISAAQQTKDRYKAQQEAIEELQSKDVNLSEALFGIKEAIQFQNDLEEAQLILADPSKSPEAKAEAEKKIEDLKTRMFENQSLKAFKTGTTETLINLYKSIVEGDPVEMEAFYGKDYKEKVAQAIADIENLENVYENYEDYANVDEIFYNRANKIRAERIRGYYEGLHEDADLDLRNQLSEISKKYKFKKERTITEKRNGKETTSTVTDESPLYFKSDNIEENQGDTEENKKIYDEFLKEVQETGAYKKEKRYKELLNENQQLQNDNQENFNEITSSKYQKEFAKKKQEEREKLETLKEINTTKSIADLEKMRAEYSENEEVKKAIDKRIEAVKLAQAEEAKIKKNNVIKQNITSKITNAKDTDTLDKVRAELGKTDLSKEEKTELSNLINAKATELAGGPVVPGTAPASSATNSDITNTEENSDINRHKDAPDYESDSEEAGRLENESKRTAADIAEDGKRSGVDEEGRVYHYERSQAGEGTSLAASLSREYTQTDDSTNVTREDIDNDIIGSDLNKLLLNPNNLNPGVKITFKVNEDYSGKIYKSDSTKKETIEWQARLKQLKEKYGDDYKNSSEYINEVPIVAIDSNEQEVFYMHATSWINPENLEGTPENLEIDRKNLVALRSEVIGKGELKSEITSRSSGVLMRTKDNENISLAEAMPDEDLVLGIGEKDDSNIYHTNGKPIEGDIINKQDPRNGALYAIVRISKGKSIAVPVSRQSISEKVADTIYNAIVAHLTGDTKNPVVQAVYEATGGSRGGIDITTHTGLRKYLKQFIYLFPTEGQAGLETILANKTSSFSSENGIITVTPNGIEFGRPGIQMGQNTFARVVSPHFTENQNTQGLLALRSFLFNTDTQTSYLKTNADKESLKNNGPVIFVDAEGNTTTTATYTEFLKGQFQTNIFSANIGTEENPNWIYTIQPKITFDTSAVKTEEVTVPPKPKAAAAAQPTQTSEVEIKEGVSDIFKENKKLSKIGTQEQYSQYLDSIFPESKVKDIVYHTSLNKNITKFNDSKIGIHFGTIKAGVDRILGLQYSGDILDGGLSKTEIARHIQEAREDLATSEFDEEGNLNTNLATEEEAARYISKSYSTLLNISNVKITNDLGDDAQWEDKIKNLEVNEGFKYKNRNEDIGKESYVITKSEQTHILGSKKDIQGFKNFVAQPTQQASEVGEGIVVKRGKNSYTVTPEGVVISGATGKPLDNQESNFAKWVKEKAEETKETTTVLPEGPEIVIEEEEAAAIDTANTLTSEQIAGILENIEQGTDINDPVTGVKIEGKALTEFQNILRRAQEIQAENAPKKVFVPGIGWVDVTKDDESDDGGEYTDEFVPEIEDLKGALKEEAEVLIIDGLNSEEQHSLIGWITQGIVEDKEGKKTAFDKKKKTLIALEKAYRDAGLVNKANRVKKILDQFDKVKSLTNEYLATIETGRVQEASAEENEAAIVRKDFGDDFSVTLDSKGTASANLRKFFGFVTLTENGEEVKNSLGLPVVEDFDTIYNTLHEILANLPADLDMMIKVMESYKDTFPWLQDIITKIQKADESVQNEFVSDMAKHAITMRFLLWKKNKNGGYRLMDMNANSSSIKKRLLNIWKSNLKGATEGIYTEGTGSNLVTIDAETGEYIYNQEEVKRLMAQAKEWFEMSPEERTQIPVEDLAMWLGNFGIVLSDKTYEDLKDGKFYNNGIIAYSSLFTNQKGLVRVLAKELYAINSSKPSLLEKNILEDSVIKSIASIEAKNSLNIYSNSFNAGGKTIYTYTNNKYLVNRVRDLLAADEALIKKLKQIDFTKDSLWLEDLLSENEEIAQSLKDRLGVDYLSLEALKEMFTKSLDNRKLNNLTAAEQEVIKIGLFQSQSYDNNIDGTNKRKVSFFYPTMSDKSTMMIINTMSYDLGMEDIANGMMSTESAELLYKALILPEINRMAGAKRNSNIAGYEPDYFYFLPELNDVMVSHPTAGNKLLKDLAIDGLATDPAVQEQLVPKIKSIFQGLVHDKLRDWDALGIGASNKKGIYSLLDFKYMNNNAMGLGEDKRAYAAADFVFNSLIANAEMFKLFIGDPAQYAKNITTNEDGTVNLEETFVNIGKRLAGDIAPGLELANSEKNSYYQILLEDSILESKNIEYLEKLVERGVLSKEDLKAYKEIETTDAQEYTTWQEHLYVMKQLGRLTTKQYKDISSKLKKGEKLSESELGIVLQPMKPVYVGNQVEVGNNLDRRIYIKSSSFPLLPQLTKGSLEIDKVRQLLEDFQESKKKEKTADGSPPTVRASFGSAIKVGGIKNGVKIFDKDGNVNDNIEIADDQFLILSRKNFRIQQDVPYKETKAAVNIGTQERKLLFLNMLDVSGFTYEGKEHTGQELNDIYTELYKELFEHKQKQFAKEFGIDLEGELSVPAKKYRQS